MRQLLVVIVVVTGIAAALGAQASRPGEDLAFEAASIKPTPFRPGIIRVGDGTPAIRNASFEANGITVVGLLRYAYPTLSGELRGAPDWAAAERFDGTRARGRARGQSAMASHGSRCSLRGSPCAHGTVDLHWNAAPLADKPADRPSLPSAIEEQLGLKLMSERGPVEIVVIDHIEPPTPD
jgi:hypothetical protein